MCHPFLCCLVLFLCNFLNAAGQSRYAVVITEFLPDPSPAIGLPDASFVELKNISAAEIQLQGWTIGNGHVHAEIKSPCLIKPDSFLILCSRTAENAYSAFGPVLGLTGFPALDNDEGEVLLCRADGSVIHGLHYDKSWFDNPLKAAGGWSLEIKDPDLPCVEKSNWTASTSPSGGTPGRKNLAQPGDISEDAPVLLRSFATDSLHLILQFSGITDSGSAETVSHFMISPGIGQPLKATTLPPFYDKVMLELSQPLVKGLVYSVSAEGISGCNRSENNISGKCPTGLAADAKPGDLIINELLFNPPPLGFDYLELYNNSKKILRLADIYVASAGADGSIKPPVRITEDEWFVYPGEFILLTEDPGWIITNYPTAVAAALLKMATLPSMPDDAGKVFLLNRDGQVLDEVDYDHHWHSPLLTSESGVSLERISPDAASSLGANWSSASTSTGYGTPGYKNSMAFTDEVSPEWLSADPKIFSPDQDGYRDYCFIHYQLDGPGYTGSLTIYDINGRLIRRLADHSIWGVSGMYRWDGLDDMNRPLAPGHYILFAELFQLSGKIIRKKLVVTLAG